MSAPIARGPALLRRYLAGVVFLAVLAGLVSLSVALYTKRFTSVVLVELRTDRIGNQLATHADVKLRGVVVGEVRRVASAGDGATVQLAIRRDKAALVPADVTAQLLPKTLFGEKEVALQPGGGGGRAIRTGDVITQDRTATSIETERVLNDALPLLRSLRPAELSAALNALSSALRGRGDRLGASFVKSAAYLHRLNPQLPAIQQDFRGLADLTQNYATTAPDILRLLDNASYGSRSLVDQKDELATFLTTTTGMAEEAERFVRVNRESLIRLAEVSRPVTALYAKYSPEYKCMLHVLPIQEIEGERVFGGELPGLHITLEVTRDQGPYNPGDEPQFYDQRGPTCYGLDKRIVPFPAYYNPKDGYQDESPAPSQPPVPAAANDPAAALSGADREHEVLALAAAPALGSPPQDVPDITDLLFGPVARGTTVGYSAG